MHLTFLAFRVIKTVMDACNVRAIINSEFRVTAPRYYVLAVLR